MIILSHRGYWHEAHEKNTRDAFTRSFQLGFGTETDIRDHGGDLVISHDMPMGSEMRLTQFLSLIPQGNLPLAVNIKADGLASTVKQVMNNYPIEHWFVFDMSVPDTRSHLQCGNPVFARVSEIEPEPIYFDEIKGIWLDAFLHDGWQFARIEPWLMQNKRVCLVSPELHGRSHLSFWKTLLQQSYLKDNRLMLCTDFPQQAHQFFGEYS